MLALRGVKEECKPYGSFFYDVKVDSWRNRSRGGKEPYKPKPGDIFILPDALPKPSDLILKDMEGRGVSASVTKVAENEDMANNSKVSNDDPTHL
ncbi:hypothetical protein IFM89_000207 [Coptis chinensis]|uniref:DUF6469 domain-containing protein n=1 Tax=Coptis chinensis TaxID=261450 RepID=A0A835M3B2_9MAGN|nr:hypothetical protein IFM89_000207 [Coptis chinensis]